MTGTNPVAKAVAGALPPIAAWARWVSLALAVLAGIPSSCTADEPAKRKTPDKDWWSLKPVVRPKVPDVKNAIRVRNPIDAFILAKLEARGSACRRMPTGRP
jgi:hypothetical protein